MNWYVVPLLIFVIYTGLNLEIATFFAVAPLIIVKLLPKDRELKIKSA